MTEDSYKQNALKLQEAIRRAGGLHRAVDIIEQVITTGKPFLLTPDQETPHHPLGNTGD